MKGNLTNQSRMTKKKLSVVLPLPNSIQNRPGQIMAPGPHPILWLSLSGPQWPHCQHAFLTLSPQPPVFTTLHLPDKINLCDKLLYLLLLAKGVCFLYIYVLTEIPSKGKAADLIKHFFFCYTLKGLCTLQLKKLPFMLADVYMHTKGVFSSLQVCELIGRINFHNSSSF